MSSAGVDFHRVVSAEAEQYTLSVHGDNDTHVLKLLAKDVDGGTLEVVLFSDERLMVEVTTR